MRVRAGIGLHAVWQPYDPNLLEILELPGRLVDRLDGLPVPEKNDPPYLGGGQQQPPLLLLEGFSEAACNRRDARDPQPPWVGDPLDDDECFVSPGVVPVIKGVLESPFGRNDMQDRRGGGLVPIGNQEKTRVVQMLRAYEKWIWDYFKEFSAAILLQK